MKIVPLSWPNMYEGVQEKRIDAIMDITPRPDREALFNFTAPYLSVPHSIVAPRDTVYHENLDSLKGKTVAVESRFFMEGLLHEKYPDIKVKSFNTTSDALDAVTKREADAYVGNRAVATYIIERELIANLEIQGKIEETASVNAIGVRKDRPVLRDILQKALDDLSNEEISEILEGWKSPHEAEKAILLSKEEKAWLKDHPRITIAFDGDYAPYSSRNEKGEFKGIAVDFARELASRAGIGLDVYPEGTWKRLYEAGQERKVDVIATLVLRPKRQPFFEFTKPYISIAQYVITRKGDDTIHGREDVVGKTIAVVKGYATTDQILNEFPSVKPYPVDDLTAALEAVSTGKAEITVAGMGQAHNLIAQKGFSNLKFAALYDQGFSDERFGVRKDWPELASILDKALDSLADHERLKIFQRWSLPEIARVEAVTEPRTLDLTPGELAWLAAHPVLHLGYAKDWPPVEYVDRKGRFVGMTADFMETLGHIMGVTIKSKNRRTGIPP